MNDTSWFLNLITCFTITMAMVTPFVIFAIKVKVSKMKADRVQVNNLNAFKNRNRVVNF